MATFSPPLAFDVPRVAATPHRGDRLMRHYSPLPRGRNVYLLVDGSVTEVQPYEATPGTVIQRVFFGGHAEQVNAAEVAILTAAGYGPNIT